jgi:polyisoprenoid-binding protein YceI
MKPLYRFLLILAAWAAVLSTATANEVYKINTAHSSISFKVHQYLAVTNGKFKKFGGTIDIDRDHPEKSSVVAKIDVRSIDTGIRKRDDHLRSAEFFNVGKFSEITFKSQSVKQTGQQSGDIMGDFTMHGVTKPITLHVKLLTPLRDEASMQHSRWEVTTAPLKRRDFGLMFGSSTEAVSGIGQEVAINIEIEAVKSR